MFRKICWLLKFQAQHKKYVPSVTYYDGFTFKGEHYTLGWAKLNEDGIKLLKAAYPWVKIVEYYTHKKPDRDIPAYRLQYCVPYYGWNC